MVKDKLLLGHEEMFGCQPSWDKIPRVRNPPNPNLEWRVGVGESYLAFSINEKKTWHNRFKWWISTKLFLPGTYKWLEKDK